MTVCKCYSMHSFILQTDEAEITAVMPIQRVRVGESRAGNKLSNGPLRAQSNVACHRVFCDVEGRRYGPGICWYPAKGTGSPVNSRWHRG